MRATVILLTLIGALGCHSYQPGSFAHASASSAGSRATVGCLDIAVTSARDDAAVGPVARLAIGNRCDRAVRIDIGAIRASGLARTGASVAHYAYDPRAEIGPALLDGRSVAVEVIEYRAVDAEARVTALCFDVSALAAEARDAAAAICIDVDTAIAGVGR